MVKKVKKDFTSGLDMLIQKTTVSDEPEITKIEVSQARESKGEKEAEKQITITIPASMKRSMKRFCAENDITIKDLFIRSVNRYMKDVD